MPCNYTSDVVSLFFISKAVAKIYKRGIQTEKNREMLFTIMEYCKPTCIRSGLTMNFVFICATLCMRGSMDGTTQPKKPSNILLRV
jgi:hypothetical protein